MFPLTATTLALSLIGHIIFGTVLGVCCVAARTWTLAHGRSSAAR